MVIGKTRTNIRAEIDDQFEVISQMIKDIAEHYQGELNNFENQVETICKEESGNEIEVYCSLTNDFAPEIDKRNSLCIEARKIIFCSIFSYFETMLYGVISYYNIQRGERGKVKQLIDIISSEYKKRSSGQELELDNKNIIIDFYRPLRNLFMHGQLDNGMEKIKSHAAKFTEIAIKNNHVEIINNSFLFNALQTIYRCLTEIDSKFALGSRNIRPI